jgi:hypothetical protein
MISETEVLSAYIHVLLGQLQLTFQFDQAEMSIKKEQGEVVPGAKCHAMILYEE